MRISAKKLVLGGVLVVSALVLTSCSGSAVSGDSKSSEAVDEVVIGALHPLSGANAADGQQMKAAAEMAVDEINKAGGIKSLDGAKLVLKSADTKGEPETGQSEASRLIQEGADALVGSFQSSTSANIAAVAERNGVPFVMDVSALDSILDQGYTNSFRIQPSAGLMGKRGAEYLSEIVKDTKTPVTNVGYLYEQGNYGTAAYEGFKKEAEADGIKVSAAISYDPTASDLTTQVQQALAGGAEVLAVSGYYNDGMSIARSLEAIKPKLTAVLGVAHGGYDQMQFVEDAPNGGENYLNANYRINTVDARAKKVTAAFEKSYGEPMRTSAAHTYDAVSLIAEAIESAKSSDPAKIRDAIAATDYMPIVVNNGAIKFDKTGQNVNATVAVTQIQDGKVLTVFPKDLAEAEIIFPAPLG